MLRPMWDGIQQKVDRLRSLDRRRAIFGAGHHRYQQNPPATTLDIERTEDRLGVALPSELRELYQTLGDGDLGPHLGMTRLEDVEGYTPNQSLQTDQQLYDDRARRSLDRHATYVVSTFVAGATRPG